MVRDPPEGVGKPDPLLGLSSHCDPIPSAAREMWIGSGALGQAEPGGPDDEAALEGEVDDRPARRNTAANARSPAPFAGRVAIADPPQVEVVAHIQTKIAGGRCDPSPASRCEFSARAPGGRRRNPRALGSRPGARRRRARSASEERSACRPARRPDPAAWGPPLRWRRAALTGRGVAARKRDRPAHRLDKPSRLSSHPAGSRGDLVRRSSDDARTRKPMNLAGIPAAIAPAGAASIGGIGRFATPRKPASRFGPTSELRGSGTAGRSAGASPRGPCHGSNQPGRGGLIRVLRAEPAAGVPSARPGRPDHDADPAPPDCRRTMPSGEAGLCGDEHAQASAARRRPHGHGPAGHDRDRRAGDLRRQGMDLAADAEAACGRMVEGWQPMSP